MSKGSEYTKGYKRGLEGKGSSSTWGDVLGDSTINEEGSGTARSEGYQEGLRDRARDKKKK